MTFNINDKLPNGYSKNEIEELLATKANSSEIYTQEQINELLANQAITIDILWENANTNANFESQTISFKNTAYNLNDYNLLIIEYLEKKTSSPTNLSWQNQLIIYNLPNHENLTLDYHAATPYMISNNYDHTELSTVDMFTFELLFRQLQADFDRNFINFGHNWDYCFGYSVSATTEQADFTRLKDNQYNIPLAIYGIKQ